MSSTGNNNYSSATAESKPIANILIIDDEEDIGYVIKTGLIANHFLAKSFTSPKEAMAHFSQHSKDYCLVLSDVRMPGMNGFDVVKEVKEINPEVKTILMTSFEIERSEFSKVMPTAAAATDDVIKKPASIETIKNRILQSISQSKRLLQ